MIDHFSEQGFFLQAHSHRNLFVVLTGDAPAEAGLAELARVAKQLAGVGARLAICYWEHAGAGERLTRLCHEPCPLTVRHQWPESHAPSDVGWLWPEEGRVALAGVTAGSEAGFLAWITRLATTLRVGRVILAREAGGLGLDRGYLTPHGLARLLPGAAPELLPVLEAMTALLKGGVGAVSLCRLEALGQELFTYEGSGTFIARHHYCRVRPLGLDDFAQAAAVIRRGEREGYLLPRGKEQIWEVLVGGYGAFLAENRLAGVCGLLTRPYQGERAGELVSLYTLTRFTGEGVAGHLVRRMRQEGRKAGLAYLFACTSSPGVVAFFQRHGYRVSDRVPEAKWRHYDPARRQQVTCLRLELER